MVAADYADEREIKSFALCGRNNYAVISIQLAALDSQNLQITPYQTWLFELSIGANIVGSHRIELVLRPSSVRTTIYAYVQRESAGSLFGYGMPDGWHCGKSFGARVYGSPIRQFESCQRAAKTCRAAICDCSGLLASGALPLHPCRTALFVCPLP